MKKEEKYTIDVLFSQDQIKEKIAGLALKISCDFKGKDPLIIAVLKGSFVFCADLIRNLDPAFAVDFISLSSYSGSVSEGKIRVISNLKENLEGRDVIIVEDIIDTGLTLDFLLNEFKKKEPKSITTCVLLDKKCARVKDVSVEYRCFEINDDFVVGYGLDYSGFFRGLPYIGILKIEK